MKYFSPIQLTSENRERSTYFPLEFFDELSKAKTLGDVLRCTSYWIKKIFRSDRVSIALQKDNKHLSLFALSGDETIPLERPIPIVNTMVGHVFANQKLAICQDTSAESLLDCEWLAESGLLSCMDAPLIHNDRCYGAINIAHRQKNQFTDEEARVLSSLASWIASQIRMQKQMVKMESLVNIDTLTGVLNRHAFMEATQLINDKRRAFDKNHALLIIDIDRFKAINDQHGHLGGDEVLIALAKRIQNMKRKNDMFARIGGEEFVLLLSEITESDAIEIAKKYRQSIEDMVVHYEGKHLRCTVSIGLSIPLDNDVSFRDILSRADTALYEAKNAGRNQVGYWGAKTKRK